MLVCQSLKELLVGLQLNFEVYCFRHLAAVVSAVRRLIKETDHDRMPNKRNTHWS